eukprot:259896-Prymnesium_polylepis.1
MGASESGRSRNGRWHELYRGAERAGCPPPGDASDSESPAMLLVLLLSGIYPCYLACMKGQDMGRFVPVLERSGSA